VPRFSEFSKVRLLPSGQVEKILKKNTKISKKLAKMNGEGAISGTYLIKSELDEFEDSTEDQFRLVLKILGEIKKAVDKVILK